MFDCDLHEHVKRGDWSIFETWMLLCGSRTSYKENFVLNGYSKRTCEQLLSLTDAVFLNLLLFPPMTHKLLHAKTGLCTSRQTSNAPKLSSGLSCLPQWRQFKLILMLQHTTPTDLHLPVSPGVLHICNQMHGGLTLTATSLTFC